MQESPGQCRCLRGSSRPLLLPSGGWRETRTSGLFHFIYSLHIRTHKEQDAPVPHILESLCLRESNWHEDQNSNPASSAIAVQSRGARQPSHRVVLRINEMLYITHLAQRPTHSKCSTMRGKVAAKHSLTKPGAAPTPSLLLSKSYYTLCVRKKARYCVLHSPWPSSGPRRLHCRWRGQEGVWLLLQEGGRGASGSKVPWGQAAADSHKWHLDWGGRDKRGDCPCLPETGPSLIITAAIFHHPGLPQMWQPARSQNPLPRQEHVETLLPAQRSSELCSGLFHKRQSATAEDMGGWRRINNCVFNAAGQKNTFDI